MFSPLCSLPSFRQATPRLRRARLTCPCGRTSLSAQARRQISEGLLSTERPSLSRACALGALGRSSGGGFVLHAGSWRPLARADRERRSTRGACRRTRSRGATQGVTLVLSLCLASPEGRGPRSPGQRSSLWFKPIVYSSPSLSLPKVTRARARAKVTSRPNSSLLTKLLIMNDQGKKIAT